MSLTTIGAVLWWPTGAGPTCPPGSLSADIGRIARFPRDRSHTDALTIYLKFHNNCRYTRTIADPQMHVDLMDRDGRTLAEITVDLSDDPLIIRPERRSTINVEVPRSAFSAEDYDTITGFAWTFNTRTTVTPDELTRIPNPLEATPR